MIVYLPANLVFLAKSASRPDRATKWGATAGIRVVSRDGLYVCEATDGRRLVRVAGPNDDLEWPVLDSVPDWEGEVIVPTEAWVNVFNLARKGGKDYKHLPNSQGVAVASAGPNDLLLCTFSTTIRSQPVEGRFPNTNQVWPAKPARWSISVDPDYMIDALQIARQLTDDESRGVTMIYRGLSEPMGLVSKVPSLGQVMDVLVLPLYTAEQQRKDAERRRQQGRQGKPVSCGPADDREPARDATAGSKDAGRTAVA